MKKLLLFIFVVFMAFGARAQQTYVLLTGVSKYPDRKAELNYTTNDVKRLDSVIFKKQSFIVHQITGKYVVCDTLSRRITAIAQLAKPEDTIIFFFAGHGLNGGIVMHDLSLFPYHDLINLLSLSKAKHKICFIDACHSGSGVTDITNSYKSWGTEATNHKISFVMGCRADEYSYEDDKTGHGLFSQALLTGLAGNADGWGKDWGEGENKGKGPKDKKVTLIELYHYVYNDVTLKTKPGEKSPYPKQQHPQLIGPGSAHETVLTRW